MGFGWFSSLVVKFNPSIREAILIRIQTADLSNFLIVNDVQGFSCISISLGDDLFNSFCLIGDCRVIGLAVGKACYDFLEISDTIGLHLYDANVFELPNSLVLGGFAH